MNMPRKTRFPKLIYFAERHPALSREGFIPRWRQHARLGMSMPRWRNIWSYSHCDAISNVRTDLPIHACDGVAIVRYRSEAARQVHVADRAAGPVLKQDELETFARSVRDFAVLTDEYVCITESARDDGNRAKLFLRLHRPTEMSFPVFSDRLLGAFRQRLEGALYASGACAGFSLNLSRPVGSGTSVHPVCDAVAEIAATDPAPLTQTVSTAVADMKNETEFADWRAIWTIETILHPACPGNRR